MLRIRENRKALVSSIPLQRRESERERERERESQRRKVVVREREREVGREGGGGDPVSDSLSVGLAALSGRPAGGTARPRSRCVSLSPAPSSFLLMILSLLVILKIWYGSAPLCDFCTDFFILPAVFILSCSRICVSYFLFTTLWCSFVRRV